MLLYIFPIAAAILYGYYYATLGRVVQVITLPTLFFYSSLCGMTTSALYAFINRQSYQLLLPFQDKSTAFLLFSGLAASWGGWLFTTAAIKGVSPTFAGICEVSYPIFVILFAYLLFGEKQWDMATLIGGAFIFIGLFIIIYDKAKS